MMFGSFTLVIYLWVFIFLNTACKQNNLPTDVSPHQENTFIANNAKLEFLDWGGEGPHLLLLAGLGNTAHLFDDLAPKLKSSYHVWGISRRAHGRSQVTPEGYGLDTLVFDLKAFVDGQNIDKVILMGHSFGGLEMTRFGQLYPDKVKALIYLESAYDYRQINQLWAADPVAINPSTTDLKNIMAGKDWFIKHFNFWSAAVETDTRIVNEQKDGSLRLESMPPSIMAKFIQTMSAFKPDYRSFTFPVMAFYAQTKEHPFIQSAHDSIKQKANYYWQNKFLEDQQNSIDLLKKQCQNARVVILPETKHLCYIREQDQAIILKNLKNLF